MLAVLLAAVAAGCGGGGHGAEAVSASSCGRMLYEGTGKPDVVIVSDFPLRGVGAENTREMVKAIELVLRRRAFRAGEHRVGYQSCNDTVGDEPFDPLLCKQNARAYVGSEDVVGIVGPWNSGCAWEQIPIVTRRSAGPLAMISPSNTYTGLTRTVGRGSGAWALPGRRPQLRTRRHARRRTGDRSGTARRGARRTARGRRPSGPRRRLRPRPDRPVPEGGCGSRDPRPSFRLEEARHVRAIGGRGRRGAAGCRLPGRADAAEREAARRGPPRGRGAGHASHRPRLVRGRRRRSRARAGRGGALRDRAGNHPRPSSARGPSVPPGPWSDPRRGA